MPTQYQLPTGPGFGESLLGALNQERDRQLQIKAQEALNNFRQKQVNLQARQIAETIAARQSREQLTREQIKNDIAVAQYNAYQKATEAFYQRAFDAQQKELDRDARQKQTETTAAAGERNAQARADATIEAAKIRNQGAQSNLTPEEATARMDELGALINDQANYGHPALPVWRAEMERLRKGYGLQVPLPSGTLLPSHDSGLAPLKNQSGFDSILSDAPPPDATFIP